MGASRGRSKAGARDDPPSTSVGRPPPCEPAPGAPWPPPDPVHEARIALLGELMASIAHEVTQPLAAVVASGDAGMRWLRRGEPNIEEAIAAFSIMISQARRACDIVASTRAMAAKAEGDRVT